MLASIKRRLFLLNIELLSINFVLIIVIVDYKDEAKIPEQFNFLKKYLKIYQKFKNIRLYKSKK